MITDDFPRMERDIVRDQGSQPAESGFGLADTVAVWGFVLPPPRCDTPMIMVSSRYLPA
jgi:hypothetical protein